MTDTITVPVEGMTCGGCTRSVQQVLEKLSGVDHVEVRLDPGQARVSAQAATVSRADVVAAIEQAGFVVPR